jgi:Fe2+ transport system protein FeoA
MKMIFNFRRTATAIKSGLISLSNLPEGCSAVIATVDEGLTELMELGFVPGTQVKPTHSGLGGDPRVYELDGTLVALRRSAARQIYVSLPDEAGEEGI